MQIRIIFLFLLIFLTVSNAFGQIVIEEKPNPEKTEEKKESELFGTANRNNDRDVDSVTRLYFNSNWSKSYRELVPNGDLFGEDLGKRADEVSANFWSFGVGLRNRLGKHFELEVGLGYMRNGERYSFTLSDTNYNYTTRYNFISMPIVAYYTYGSGIKFLAGAGFVPQLFMSQVQNTTWKTTNNTPGETDVKTKSGTNEFASFTSSILFRVGIELKYSNYWALYLIPEYRQQVSSTYGKTSPYTHRANAFGFNLGLTYLL